jgi:XTP/dITP diphosphohydrolase
VSGVIRLTFVSTNPGKAREVREILAPYGIRVHWRRRRLPEPQADDLSTVVRSKLAAVKDIPGNVLVEDSGLFIDSLAGFPGVYSAHFLSAWGFGPMLELLRRRARDAEFRAAAGLRVGSRTRIFTGTVRGTIAPRARGTAGFGYDPIFVPHGWTKTFAQVPPAAKNRLSHRSRAVRKVGEYLARRTTTS